MNDYDQYIEMMNKPKVPSLQKESRFGTISHVKNVNEAIAFLSFFIGLKSTWQGFQGVECGMSIDRSCSGGVSCYIYFCVTPNLHGNYSSIHIHILQRLMPYSFEDKYIYSDYEGILRALVDCLKDLCNRHDIENNLHMMKDCRVCKKIMFIDKEDCVCRFCNPELYKNKPKELEVKYGYIYFCTDDQYIKIGSSNKFPDKRVSSLSTKYHKSFVLLGYIYTDDFIKKERQIHKILSPKRIAGEWFDIPLKELEKILSEQGFIYTIVSDLLSKNDISVH